MHMITFFLLVFLFPLLFFFSPAEPPHSLSHTGKPDSINRKVVTLLLMLALIYLFNRNIF